MSVMTNEEITAEFENLFKTSDESDETEPGVDEEAEDLEEEETEEETDEEEEETEDEESEVEGEEEGEEEPEPEPQPASRQSKQNHAFAEQRLIIKKQETFIRSLGKLIGFDENASLDDIQAKVKDALIEKDARDNNIPIELARRLDRAEELLQENDRIKLEKKVQDDFSGLIDKYNLNDSEVEEFTEYLMEIGKNPLVDQNVDLDAEYLKLHFEDMVQSAVQDALAKEDARRKKVEDKAPSGVPHGAGDKSDAKISTVAELDNLFDSIDL